MVSFLPYFLFIYVTILGVGKIAKFGKELAFSSSIIDRRLNQAASAVRPTSNTPTEIFLAKNREEGAKAADANFAMEQVKRIDKEVGKMFSPIKSLFNKTLKNS